MRRLVAILLAWACLAAAGCDARPVAEPPEESAPRPVVARPQRITTTISGAVDVLADLGAMDRVVGVPVNAATPEAKDVPRLQNSQVKGMLNVEAILATDTDLLLTNQWYREALEGKGIPAHFTKAESLHLREILRWVQEVGDLVGEPAKAREIVASMQEAERRLAERTRGLRPVRVFHVEASGARAPHLIWSDMVRLAGGVNVVEGLPQGTPVSAETILAADPEVLVLTWNAPPESELVKQPGWSDMSAVKSGRIHRMAAVDNAANQFSSRCIRVAEQKFLPWFHPELRPGSER